MKFGPGTCLLAPTSRGIKLLKLLKCEQKEHKEDVLLHYISALWGRYRDWQNTSWLKLIPILHWQVAHDHNVRNVTLNIPNLLFQVKVHTHTQNICMYIGAVGWGSFLQPMGIPMIYIVFTFRLGIFHWHGRLVTDGFSCRRRTVDST